MEKHQLFGAPEQLTTQETQAMSIEEQGVFMSNIMNNIAKIKARARPRYWQDCKYSTDNGVTWVSPDDTKEEGIKVMELLPCVEFLDDDKYNDWYWCLEIDYNTGKVKGWKEGCCVETNFKVCDDGHYQIIDDKDNIVWDSDIEHKDYVPNFLELDSSWSGDYILITVNGDGIIKNWSLAKERISELLGSQAEERLERGNNMDDLFYNKIDFFCYEKEPNVVVITPEGTRLVSTNDPAVFTYVRLVIKKNKLKGYKVVTDDGEFHDILSNGKVRDYPEGKLPGDLYGKILQELI